MTQMVLKLDETVLKGLKRRFYFPNFIQPRFISEWLIAKPVGYEKRYKNDIMMHNCAKVWKQEELPLLFTPINSKDILQSRYLTVAFAMIESTYTTPDNFAYANFDLDQLLPLEGSKYQKEFIEQRT